MWGKVREFFLFFSNNEEASDSKSTMTNVLVGFIREPEGRASILGALGWDSGLTPILESTCDVASLWGGLRRAERRRSSMMGRSWHKKKVKDRGHRGVSQQSTREITRKKEDSIVTTDLNNVASKKR